MEAIISPNVLKAAKLFVSKEETRHSLRSPWVQRIKGRSIIVATDGHTMLVAEDKDGKNYPRRPMQVCEKPDPDFKPVDWASVVRLCATPPKKRQAVWFNPRYVERVAKAAKILGVNSSAISLSAPHEAAAVHLGPMVTAFLMPMRQYDVPHIPAWLGETVAVPEKKAGKRRAKKAP
jgi:hypothetical protein